MSAKRGAAVLISGQAGGFILRFVRNILVARLLTVEDYGIASTFVVAMSLVQMSTNLNFRTLLIQSRDGDDPDFMAAIQGLNVLRGFAIGAILFLTAAPIARLMGQPELIWPYQMVAILPIIGAFGHTDVERLHRTMRFGATVIQNLSALSMSLLLLWPLALWLGDFRVMLGLYVVEQITRTGISHVIAERRYRLVWDKDVAIQGLRFGWPLLLAGALLFATQQGDRIIVANQFGAHMLGLFSAAVNLTMPLALLLAGLSRTFFLPLLSKAQDAPALFADRAAFAMQATLCAGLLGVVGFGILGPPVLLVIFGEKYTEALPMVGMIGTIFALAIPRAGLTTVAIAKGHTINMLITNSVRISFLPLVVWVAITTQSVLMLLTVSLMAEMTALFVAFLLLQFQTRLGGLGRMVLPYGLAVGCIALMAVAIHRAPENIAGLTPLSLGAVGLFLGVVLSCRTLLTELRARFLIRG
ncbi:oligosaccharide flippase family protein [Actibacterium sp. 188UL27-1]|uniref:oligosaccharide flippase family protein n=1 Tax=Actibacterium sp. 188UL27-1 TaxID=2786961 RepID=UPI00195C4F25|nr:oligosaccharide flippase family protein [Actibacterium sp. 188UL27-1]MBM7070208.1 oligosaccharide flippase family protein [Actibacterium sp. 188UL27-1]